MALHLSERLSGAHRAILAYAWGAWLLGFYSLMLLSFTLEPIRRTFDPSESELAWLTGIALGGTGAGGFLFGWLADRVGRRTSIGLAIAVFALGNAACAAAPTLGWLIVARGLAGLGIGGSWGGGQTLVGETFPAAARGRFGAIVQTGAPLGLGLAAAVGPLALEVGWRTVFALSAAPALLLLMVSAVPESDVWRASERATSVARELLAPANLSLFVRCTLLTAFNMSNYWFAVVWLPRYLQRERGLTEAGSAQATLVFVVGSLAGYLAFGHLSDRFGRRPTFTAFCALSAGGLALFTFGWPLVAGAPWRVLAFLFVAGLGTGTWSGYGPMFAEIFPTRVRGTALSVIMNATRGVQFAAPVVIAALTPRWGAGAGIVLAAGFAILAGGWIWTLPETRGRALTG